MKNDISAMKNIAFVFSMFLLLVVAFVVIPLKEKETTQPTLQPQLNQNIKQEHIMFTIELTPMIMADKTSPIISDLLKLDNLTVDNTKYTTIAQRIHALLEGEKLFGGLDDSEKKELENLRNELKTTPNKMSLIFCQIRPGKTITDVETYLVPFGGRVIQNKSVQVH